MLAAVALEIRSYFSSYTSLSKESKQSVFLIFIESSLAAIYYFLSLYFVEVLKIKISTAGLIVSFYGLGTIFGGLLGGKMSDNMTPRTVSTYSLLGQAVTFLILTKIKTPPLIAVDLFVLGVATYSFITSNYVYALNFCKDSENDRLNVINALSAASNLGIGVASLVIGELVIYDFQYIFYYSGFSFLILTVLLSLKRNQLNIQIINKDNDKSKSKSTNCLRAEKLESKNNMSLVLSCLFFTGMIVSQLSTTYSVFLKNNFPNLGMHAFGVFFFVSTCLIVLFQNYLVNKFSNSNKIMMIGIGSFLIGFGAFLLNFSSTFIFMLLTCFIYSFGEMIFFSLVQLYCYQQGAESKKGSALGIYRMVYASSRFIGPAVGGALFYYLNGSMLWYLSGLIGLVFLLLCNYYKKLI